MADLVRFPLDFEDSSAYRSVDRLAAYTNKKFASIRFGGNSNQNVFSSFDRQARSFNRTLEFANDRMVAFAATTTIVYGLGRAFAALYQNAIKAEKALAEIQVNVKLTNREMSQLTSDLFKAANATGNSFYTAAEAAAEFGRQGLKAADIAKATHSALVLTQISGMDAADSVKSLTAAINTFGKAAGGYEGIVNKMAAADTSFAVSSKDLADAIGRVGSTAKDAGVGLNELLAMVTSLQQTTARGGAVIGNSLKNNFYSPSA
jgi:TP901 family phage tail tape measure protein